MISVALAAIVLGVSAAPVEAQSRSGAKLGGGVALMAVGGLLTLNSHSCRADPAFNRSFSYLGSRYTASFWGVSGSWAWSQCDAQVQITNSWGVTVESGSVAELGGGTVRSMLNELKSTDQLRLWGGLGLIAGGAVLAAFSASGPAPIVIEADPAGFEISRSIGW